MSTVRNKKLSKSEKTEVVANYYKLVKKIATGLARKSTDPVEDLIQVGLIALLEAAENYQESHNTMFQTYAVHYISGHIRHYLRDKQSLMKGPRALQELSYKMSLVIKNLSHKLGREPNNQEISRELEVSEIRVDEVKAYEKKISVIWLDQIISPDNDDDDNNKPMIDNLFYQDDPPGIGEHLEDKIILRDAIKKLEPQKRELLELRYFKDLTQIELSNLLGISQMEVCRKLRKAEKELKALIV